MNFPFFFRFPFDADFNSKDFRRRKKVRLKTHKKQINSLNESQKHKM
jgi:hypothetical protein